MHTGFTLYNNPRKRLIIVITANIQHFQLKVVKFTAKSDEEISCSKICVDLIITYKYVVN